MGWWGGQTRQSALQQETNETHPRQLLCLLNLVEKDKAGVRRGDARCRNCVAGSGSPSCNVASHSWSYHLWDTDPAVLCICACQAQLFLTDYRSCRTNWATLESKMDAINNCVWTIDLNLNGPEQNEEALFQTCVFKDWIPLSRFFVLKAISETLTDLGRGWQLRTFCLFVLYESGHLIIGHNWVVTVWKLRGTLVRDVWTSSQLPEKDRSVSGGALSPGLRAEISLSFFAFLGYEDWAYLKYLQGKNVKKKADKDHERKWLPPLPSLTVLSKAGGELGLPCASSLFRASEHSEMTQHGTLCCLPLRVWKYFPEFYTIRETRG